MRISRFFVDRSCFDTATGVATLSNESQIRQIRTVLRLRSGDRVDLLDGEGMIYHCSIDSIGGEKVQRGHLEPVICRIESAQPGTGESDVRLSVALPLLKNSRFEWAIEKLTELGVSQIVPTIVARSVVLAGGREEAGKLNNKSERWHTIAREAAEQCERSLIPNVVNPQNFADFVKMDFGVSPVKLISAERKDASLLSEALESAVNTKTICIAVGAEGGFTEAEFALSFAHGFKPVGLGKRILRAETAAIYSASIVASRLDR